MSLFSKKDKNCTVKSIKKFATIGEDTLVKIIAKDRDKILSFEMPFSEAKPITLNYNQITNIDYISETEIINKQKSVCGRAVIGGLALGPLGAIVGGMSGMSTKNKKDIHFYLVINYTSQSGEDDVLIFEDTKLFGVSPFCKYIQNTLRLKGSKSDTTITEL